MSVVDAIARYLFLLVTIGVVSLVGCGPSFEASPSAVAWPLMQQDPAEDGVDTGRWPAWRGRNGSGIAPGGSPPIIFGDDEGVRWKVPVPGSGHSSPVVWDDFVLLTTALDTTDPPTLAVLCIDRADGGLLWQKEAGKAQGPTHTKNGYASATVATDGRRIFAFFGSTGLFCFDFSGTQLWQAELGDLDHVWGTAASPVLFDDKVIQLCDCGENSYIAAFDKETGSELWRTPRASDGCWTTPVFVEVDDDGATRTEMIVNGGADLQQVIAYDPADGSELWQVDKTTEFVTPTPMIAGGLVYCTSGRNGPIMAIRPGGTGDVTNTHVVWRAGRGGPYIPSGVVYRNRLFLVGDSKRLACYNAGNGETIWKNRLRGVFSASLIAADGRIYATSEQGTVYVFAADDSFELLAANKLGSRCLATPAVADGDLFVRTADTLHCFAGTPPERNAKRAGGKGKQPNKQPDEKPEPDATGPDPSPKTTPPPGESSSKTSDEKTAAPASSPKDAWPLFRGNPQATGIAGATLPKKLELLWTFADDNGGFVATAVVEDGTVYAGSYDGNLYAINLKTGKKRWAFFRDLGYSASPAVRKGFVYIGDADGVFHCIDAKTGKAKWSYTTEAEINSCANFHGEHVIVGSQDGSLYCLNAETGKLVWQYESDDMIQCSPTIAAGRTFVAGCNGRLTAVDLAKGTRAEDIDIEAPTLCTPAVCGSMVYVGTTGCVFFAIDWKKEKVVWRYENPERSAEFRSSAAITPGAIIVGGRDKLVHAIDPKTGKKIWTFATKGAIDSSPVVVGDRVFIGTTRGLLLELNLKTGKKQWEFEVGGSITGSPAVAAGRLIIGTDDGDLYCFGAK